MWYTYIPVFFFLEISIVTQLVQCLRWLMIVSVGTAADGTNSRDDVKRALFNKSPRGGVNNNEKPAKSAVNVAMNDCNIWRKSQQDWQRPSLMKIWPDCSWWWCLGEVYGCIGSASKTCELMTSQWVTFLHVVTHDVTK